jgi:VWFA-related protein
VTARLQSAFIAAMIAILPIALGAQAAAFHARIGLVVLQVTVKNSRGAVVTTLDRDAFSVYENGKAQPISLFSREDTPLSLGLVLDNSGSMRLARPRVEAAALELIRTSNAQDEVFVMNFADKPRLDTPLTSDLRAVEAGVARLDAIGGTALCDAVDRAETYLRDHATRDRRVLVIISDGVDNASMVSLADVQKGIERDQVWIYAIGASGSPTASQRDRGRHDLEQLAAAGGGSVIFLEENDAVEPAVDGLARQLHSQYTIAYRPLNQMLDGSYRTIRVQAKAAEHVTVTTRRGYWATAK